MFNTSKIDFKEVIGSTLGNSPWVNKVSKQVVTQVTHYEKRLRTLVSELDLKSRDARNKSKKRLDEFSGQVRRTRLDVEKRVTQLVNDESRKLNERFAEVLSYIKSLANREKLVQSAAQAKTASVGSRKKSASKARTATKRTATGVGKPETKRRKKSTAHKKVLASITPNGETGGSGLPN